MIWSQTNAEHPTSNTQRQSALARAHPRSAFDVRSPSGFGLAVSLVALLLVALAGCASPPGATSSADSSSPAIDRINIICRPVAMNFDQAPGPDGIGITLYASSPNKPKTVKIVEGTLQILLFDGLLKDSEINNKPPLRIWTYTAEDLKSLSFTGSIGICYPLALRWGDAKPTQPRMTVVARYSLPDGPVLHSSLGVISMVQ